MCVIEMLATRTSKAVSLYIPLISVKIFVVSNAYCVLKGEQRLPSRRNSQGAGLNTAVTSMVMKFLGSKVFGTF